MSYLVLTVFVNETRFVGFVFKNLVPCVVRLIARSVAWDIFKVVEQG